ncbi:MAG: ABC transporter substrate-binding protein [Coriobacteriales bacterium]|jgi:putative spermidine/putrescine transport system substrate-binding protein|nr:ABC transporter substrate-binding protein [Coriobacteriales bacterium]
MNVGTHDKQNENLDKGFGNDKGEGSGGNNNANANGKRMNRRNFLGLAAAVGTGALATGALSACSSGQSPASAPETKVLDLTNWDSILEAARGTEVHYWSWAGSDVISGWYNNNLANYLKENYDVTLKLTGVADTVDTVTQISSEMQAGIAEGSVDFLWVNGENFYTLMQANYLYGPFTQALPMNKLLDPLNTNNIYDTAVQIYGHEASWQSIYMVFTVDSAKVDFIPKNTDEFLEFCKKYPGKVTYPDVFDYAGSTIISIFFANILKEEDYMKVALDMELSKEELKNLLEPGLRYLRDLNPYLWSEGKTFPSNSQGYSQMFSDGELVLGMSTNNPKPQVDKGIFPASTRSFILEKTIQAFYYLAIPKNATNKAAAMVAINAMGMPDLQASDFEVNGFVPVVDSTRLTEEEQAMFDRIDIGEHWVPVSEMEGRTLPLPSGRNIDVITEIWREEVVGKTN